MSMMEPLPPIPAIDGQETLDLDEIVEVRIPYLPTESTAPSWGLPPFSGESTPCAKCGLGAGKKDKRIGTHYHRQVMIGSPCHDLARFDMEKYNRIGFPEHLDRICFTCQHRWVEALADGPAHQPEED